MKDSPSEISVQASLKEPNSLESSLIIESEWMTTNEAAAYLRTTPKSLLNICSNGKVTYYKRGRRNLYRRNELRELLFSQKRGPL